LVLLLHRPVDLLRGDLYLPRAGSKESLHIPDRFLLLIGRQRLRRGVLAAYERPALGYRADEGGLLLLVEKKAVLGGLVGRAEVEGAQPRQDRGVPPVSEEGVRVAGARALAVVVDDFIAARLPKEADVPAVAGIAEGAGQVREHGHGHGDKRRAGGEVV